MIQATNTTVQGYLDTLLSRRGQIVTVVTERPMKMRKAQPQILKLSEFQCRVGVNYDRIKAVQAKRTEGVLPADNAGLPWGEWAVFPYVITHKGEYYVRCTVLRNSHRNTAEYRLGDQVITREAAETACLASEFRNSDHNDVFNIRVSSIRTVR